MAAAAILNITKISISPERFDQFLRNLERWRQIGPLTVPAVKKIWISKIQDDGRPPFWKPLIRHISATVWPILMKFLRWRILAPYSGSTAKISYFWKSKMAAATTLKITKIVISPERSERSLRNLVQWCRISLSTVAAVKKFEFSKSNIADGRHFENR